MLTVLSLNGALFEYSFKKLQISNVFSPLFFIALQTNSTIPLCLPSAWYRTRRRQKATTVSPLTGRFKLLRTFRVTLLSSCWNLVKMLRRTACKSSVLSSQCNYHMMLNYTCSEGINGCGLIARFDSWRVSLWNWYPPSLHDVHLLYGLNLKSLTMHTRVCWSCRWGWFEYCNTCNFKQGRNWFRKMAIYMN